MKRFLIALAFIFFAALPAASQTQTAVSATVKDPNGIPYANGTYSIQLLPSGTNPSVNGNAIQGAFNGALDATGSFSASLWPNGSITPASTQWQFTICSNPGGIPLPMGTGTQCTSPTAITISGTAQVLSSTLSNVAPKLTNFVSPGSVTSVAATSPLVATPSPIIGAGTLSCPTCSALAPNSPGIPSANGNVYYPTNYGVKADSYSVVDGVCSNGAATITSASAHFQTLAKIKVGQLVWAISGGGQGGSLALGKTTIKSIDSDTQITANANGNTQCGSSMAVIWGDDDTAALNATWAAVLAATNCGSVQLPAAGMIISGGVLNAPLPNPGPCFSNIQSSSATIHGTGWQSTVFIPTPDFDLTTCSGGGKLGCIGPSYDDLSDFSIDGFGLPTTTVSNTTATLIPVNSPATAHNLFCQGFASNNTNLTNFSFVSSLVYSYNVWAAGCGSTGPAYGAGGPIIGSYFSPVGGTVTISAPSPGSDLFDTWFGASGGQECAATITGFAHIFGLTSTTSGPGSENCVTGAGSRAWYTGSILYHNQSIAGRGALKLTASATVSATNSTFTELGTGAFSVSVDSTSKFIDGCANVYTGNINVASGGIFVPCPGTIYPNDLNMPTLTGTGACATFSTQHGTMYYGQFTCTGATGAATITVAPGGTPAPHGFKCDAADTTTTADTITAGALSTTSCAFSAATITSNDVVTFQAIPF